MAITHPYSVALAEAVKNLMDAKPISVNALATATHIPRITLTRRLQAGGPGFTAEELAAIADVLGTTPTAISAAAEARAA